MKLRYFKKEFVLNVDLEIDSLYIEVLPSIGRYFTKYCQKMSDGVFRVEIEVPEGDLYYNFKDGASHEMIAPETNYYQGALKSWHYYRLGTGNPLPIEFYPNPSFCNRISDEWYEIRIMAFQPWIKQVTLLLCRDGEEDPVAEKEPEICFSFKGLRYLRYLIPTAEAARALFCFKIYCNQHLYFYGADKKISKSLPPLFNLAAIDPSLFKGEQLIHTGVVYHIFPDSFWRAFLSDPPASPVPMLAWNETPSANAFFGGNIKGIHQKLNYLKELGVKYLFLTSVFPAKSNHRYDCSSFNAIDPLLGSLEEFEELIIACHEQGIKMILDTILNHCGTDFWAFQDVLMHQENSSYKDWFIIDRFPVRTDTMPSYSCWWNIGSMPQFNLENPEVISYLLDVYAMWLIKYGIDGFRIDVAPELGYQVLQQFRDHIKKVRPEAFIIGEVWGESAKLLHTGLFDGVTNYLLRQNAFLAFFVAKNIKLAEFASNLMCNYFSIPFPQMLQSWSLLDSHDTARFFSLIAREEELYLAVFIQMLIPGNPVVYYGNEIGLEGQDDPDNRRCMNWDRVPGNALFDWYRRLIRIRNQERALQKGDFVILEASDESGLMLFARNLNAETVYGAVNFSDEYFSGNIMELTPPGKYRELITGRTISGNLTMEPYQVLILKRDSGLE